VSAIIVLVALVIAFFAYQYWKYRASDNGAPYVAMEHHVVEHILALCKLTEEDVLYDLGSGDGRLVIAAALTYHCKAVGIEIDKLRHLYGLYQKFILRLGERVSFINKDIFDVDLSPATVCIIYLTEQANQALEQKLLTELAPGTLVVAPSFPFSSWTPIFVDQDPAVNTPWGPTYFYEIPEKNPQTTSK
jgi:SAM-dependent methyltransferase